MGNGSCGASLTLYAGRLRLPGHTGGLPYRMRADPGFLQIIRNTKCPEGRITVHPRQIDTEAEYTLSSPESGRKMTISGSRLAQEGFSVSIPARSGVIWFYRVKEHI